MRIRPAFGAALLAAASCILTARADLEWKASDGFMPKDTSLGFLQKDSENNIRLEDETLVIETAENQSAWIELPISLPEAGAPLSVEIEADSDSQPNAAAILLSSDTKGLFTWLFDRNHLRISTDGKDNHQYMPVDVTSRRTYLYEIDGIDVRVSVDGTQIFHGRLDEPLKDLQLTIGDQSDGGGKMRLYRIQVKHEGARQASSQPRPQSATDDSGLVVWKNLNRSNAPQSFDWPAAADGLLIRAKYRAATPRQAQIYGLCEGPFGRQVVSVGTTLQSVAEHIYLEERFVLRIPTGTKKFTLAWKADESFVPFSMKELELMPVEFLAANTALERTGGMSDRTVGQTFKLDPAKRLAGIAVPLIRSFDSREIPAKLTCQVFAGDAEKARWEVPAEQLSNHYGALAVFLADQPLPLGPQAKFVISSGIAEPRFYGWYDYEISWKDPFKDGNLLLGDRAEPASDLSFFAFAGVSSR